MFVSADHAGFTICSGTFSICARTSCAIRRRMARVSVEGLMTVAHVYTVAFQGIEAREVDVQVHISDSGGGQFNVVGLADKAVAESRERVRAALSAIGL